MCRGLCNTVNILYTSIEVHEPHSKKNVHQTPQIVPPALLRFTYVIITHYYIIISCHILTLSKLIFHVYLNIIIYTTYIESLLCRYTQNFMDISQKFYFLVYQLPPNFFEKCLNKK